MPSNTVVLIAEIESVHLHKRGAMGVEIDTMKWTQDTYYTGDKREHEIGDLEKMAMVVPRTNKEIRDRKS